MRVVPRSVRWIECVKRLSSRCVKAIVSGARASLLTLPCSSFCTHRVSCGIHSFARWARRFGRLPGHDCQRIAAYLGHYLIRHRYNASRSLDELNLTTVFSIAVDALAGVRAGRDECGRCNEMIVVYACGHVSNVISMFNDSQKQRAVTLTCLARSWPGRPGFERLATIPDPRL